MTKAYKRYIRLFGLRNTIKIAGNQHVISKVNTMRHTISIICLLVITATCAIAKGDSIELANGDVMKGKVISLDDKQLKFESDVIGILNIPREKIASIHFGDTAPKKSTTNTPPNTKPNTPTKTNPTKPTPPVTHPNTNPNKPNPPTPLPTAPTTTSGTLSAIDIRQHNWLAFSKGAYRTTELTRFDANRIYPATTKMLLFHGHNDRKPIAQNFVLINKEWQPINAPTPWMQHAKSIDKVATSSKGLGTKEIQAGKQAMNCTGTQYTIEGDANSQSILTIELWRNSSLNLPTQTLAVPGFLFAMPKDIVFIKVTGTFRGSAASMDWTLQEMNAQKKIADKTIPVHIFIGNSATDNIHGKVVGRHEKWMSSHVPGGVAYIAESMRQGDQVAKTVIKVVGFGKTPPAGAPTLK